MKRTFYLVMSVLNPVVASLNPKEIIETFFPMSDVKDHLTYKLTDYMAAYQNPYEVILAFYENLDNVHQFMFDGWIEREIGIKNSTTIQYALEFTLEEFNQLTKTTS